MTAPDGRKYKMLVAPLILELDSRLDLNAIGNLGLVALANTAWDHRSNQGWGPWEVNPEKVLTANTAEAKNILLGNPATGAGSMPNSVAQVARQSGWV